MIQSNEWSEESKKKIIDSKLIHLYGRFSQTGESRSIQKERRECTINFATKISKQAREHESKRFAVQRVEKKVEHKIQVVQVIGQLLDQIAARQRLFMTVMSAHTVNTANTSVVEAIRLVVIVVVVVVVVDKKRMQKRARGHIEIHGPKFDESFIASGPA